MNWGWCYCLNCLLGLLLKRLVGLLMFFVIAKPTSFSLSQSRKGKLRSHFEEYLKPTVASSFSFLCCAVECLVMKDESFLFLSCECSSCFIGQIGWVLCVPFWCCLYRGERGRREQQLHWVLNLEWLEVKMCIWGLSSFLDWRHLKKLNCDQVWLSWKDSSGAPETFLFFTRVNIVSGKSAHLVKAKTIFLSVPFEVYNPDVAVGGVVWSSQT